MQNPAGAGVERKTGAVLSYVLMWITGIIFLIVGKNDPDVKYHGAQSVVFFGAMTVIFWGLEVIRGIFAVIGLFDVLFSLALLAVAIYTFVVWIVCIVTAASGNGERFEIPLVGSYVTPYAEQLAAAVN